MDSQLLKNRAIYVTKSGSHAYGLNVATSDLDIKGILVGYPENYLGFLEKVEQLEEKEPNDLVIYELQKFFRLTAQGNPNSIEVLFTDEKDIIFQNFMGKYIRENRQEFLSQSAKARFSGYAIAQLHRLRNSVNRNREIGEPGNWKNAMHLVRLLKMGIEIMTTGQVIVKRPDREELLAIRNGDWPYADLEKWALEQDKLLDKLYSEGKCPLPKTPNFKKLDKMCIELLQYVIKEDPKDLFYNKWNGKVN